MNSDDEKRSAIIKRLGLKKGKCIRWKHLFNNLNDEELFLLGIEFIDTDRWFETIPVNEFSIHSANGRRYDFQDVNYSNLQQANPWFRPLNDECTSWEIVKRKHGSRKRSNQDIAVAGIKSPKALREYAKEAGYSKGWVYYVGRAKGWW